MKTNRMAPRLRPGRRSGNVAPKAFSIRSNVYGNWYGYEGRRRVEMFFNWGAGMEENARDWLRERVGDVELVETDGPCGSVRIAPKSIR